MSILSQFLAGGVKSIQKGTISLINTNPLASATVAAVIPAKSIVLFGGATTTVNDLSLAPYVVLTDATTVTAIRAAAVSGGSTVAYTLVEYY